MKQEGDSQCKCLEIQSSLLRRHNETITGFQSKKKNLTNFMMFDYSGILLPSATTFIYQIVISLYKHCSIFIIQDIFHNVLKFTKIVSFEYLRKFFLVKQMKFKRNSGPNRIL